jgi:hypothetical protein
MIPYLDLYLCENNSYWYRYRVISFALIELKFHTFLKFKQVSVHTVVQILVRKKMTFYLTSTLFKTKMQSLNQCKERPEKG